jgi:protein gp37
MLGYPLGWWKRHNVFVCPEGDLGHPNVPEEFIYSVFAVMEYTWENNYVFTTKRVDRMKELLCHKRFLSGVYEAGRQLFGDRFESRGSEWGSNIWVGVSVCDQESMDAFAPALLELPDCLKRVIFSCPQLGPLRLPKAVKRGRVNWLINNKEVGCRNPRPIARKHQRALREQCVDAGIPYFLADRFSDNWSEEMGPGNLRQWPEGFLD